MNFKIDTHMHTIVSGHAYNTIDEMIAEAINKKMELIAITEHGPATPGSAHPYYFSNIAILKKKKTDIPVLYGCESNILNNLGEIDLDQFCCERQDIIIASLHSCCFLGEFTKENCTNAVLNAMENPYINIIGHPDDSLFPLDYELIVLKSKETNTILELNNSSHNPLGFRIGAKENDLLLLDLCKQYDVPIILGSDSHMKEEIGDFNYLYPILDKLNFPSELILNNNKERLLENLKQKRKLI